MKPAFGTPVGQCVKCRQVKIGGDFFKMKSREVNAEGKHMQRLYFVCSDCLQNHPRQEIRELIVKINDGESNT